MKDYMDLGGPLSFVEQSPQSINIPLHYPHTRESSYQTIFDDTMHSYEPTMQPDDEEAFQHALALVNQ